MESFTITHVFSTYEPRSEEGRFEARTVQRSWEQAANNAELSIPNAQVDMINFVLPEDKEADRIQRKHRVVDLERPTQSVSGHRVPSVGEIWGKAQELANSEWILYTNADIALTPDFYTKLYNLVHEHRHPTQTATSRDLQGASLFYQECMRAMTRTLNCSYAEVLCFANAVEWWENAGTGSRAKETEPLLKRYLEFTATLPFKCRTKIDPTLQQSMEDIILDYHQYRIEIQRWVPVAGTITRINIPDALTKQVRVLAKTSSNESSTLALTRAINRSGLRHPGNDCFFFQREFLPEPIARMTHPMGMRPWGLWVPSQFKYGDIPQVWRRISGLPLDPWTFHLGISDDVWRKQARNQTSGFEILRLAANWYEISGGQYGKAFTDLPWYCHSTKRWRENVFCTSHPPSFCRGIAHLACEHYEHPNLRAVVVYRQQCLLHSKFSNTTGSTGSLYPVSVTQPVSMSSSSASNVDSFCTFLLQSVTNGDEKSNLTNTSNFGLRTPALDKAGLRQRLINQYEPEINSTRNEEIVESSGSAPAQLNIL